MALTLNYDPDLTRVRLDVTGLNASAVTADVDRTTDGINYTAVRGGTDVDATSGTFLLDDYEWPEGIESTYRVRSYDASAVLLDTFTAAVTPTLATVWLKSIARPYLNRAVTVRDFSEVTRPARAGVFDIVGRSLPVAVSEVRGSRRYSLMVLTQTAEDADDMDFLLASGDTLFVHVPTGCNVPGGYFSCADSSQARTTIYGPNQTFTLPLTEVAAPGPDVVGVAVTWQTIVTDFADWSAVLAAFPTWEDVLDYVADPSEVIVP